MAIPSATAPVRPPLFYGWVMVAVSFVLQGVGAGNQYVTGVLLQPLQDLLQVSAAAIALLTMSAMTAVVAALSPLCGLLLQRYSVRAFAIAATAAVALSYAALAYATAAWQVALIYAVGFALGVMAGLLAGATLVSNWFIAQRGLALGIASAGTSAAGCLAPPLAAYAIERWGLRDSCLLMALASAALLPLLWRYTIDTPEQKGLRPDGALLSATAAVPAAEPNDWPLRRLLGNGPFWTATAASALTNAISGVLVIELVQMAHGVINNRVIASSLMSCALAVALISAPPVGRLFDSLGQRTMALLTLALAAVPCALLLMPASAALLIAASVCIGLSISTSLILPNVLAALNFGRSAFSAALGLMHPCIMGVFAVLLPLFGWVYDSHGNYDAALWGFLGSLSLTALFTCILPRATKHHSA